MSNVQLEDKVYNWDEMKTSGFAYDDYDWLDLEPGTYDATLDAKCYGVGKLGNSIIASFTVTDSMRKIKSAIFRKAGDGLTFLGIRDIPIRSLVRIEVKRSGKTGRAYLSGVERAS